MSNRSGFKEMLSFVALICLIFSFLVSNEISSPNLFLKILNIILLVVLIGIGSISAIKALIDAINESSNPMVILNGAILLIYFVLVIKIIYTV